jgi:hypothetical protein
VIVKVMDRTRKSADDYLRTIEIANTCPSCGGPRGKPFQRTIYEHGRPYTVSEWDNPCGHVDTYRDVLAEAAERKKDSFNLGWTRGLPLDRFLD